MIQMNFYIENLDSSTVQILKTIRKNLRAQSKLWFNSQTCNNAEEKIKRIITQIRNRVTIDENIRIDNSVLYYEWNGTEALPLEENFKALLYRNLQDKTPFIIIGSHPKFKNLLMAFLDAPQRSDLPDSFLKFKYLTTWKEIYDYCTENNIFDFRLDNERFFRRTKEFYDGARVYEDLRQGTKGNLIYLDNKHKDHYEVFNGKTKKHLGELTLDGHFDPETCVPGRIYKGS